MLDYRRFQSDQVLAFNREQAQIITRRRPAGPGHAQLYDDLYAALTTARWRAIWISSPTTCTRAISPTLRALRLRPRRDPRLQRRRGILDERAAVRLYQPREPVAHAAAGHDPPVDPPGHRPRRRRDHLFPLAELHRRLRAVPFGHRAARRLATEPLLPRGRRHRPGDRAAARSWGWRAAPIENEVAILRSFDMAAPWSSITATGSSTMTPSCSATISRSCARTSAWMSSTPRMTCRGYKVVFAPLLMLVTPEQVARLRRLRRGRRDAGDLLPPGRLRLERRRADGDAARRRAGRALRREDPRVRLPDDRGARRSHAARRLERGETYHDAGVGRHAGADDARRRWPRYTNEWYAPYAAITRNRVGRGQAIYVGAALDDAFYAKLRAAGAARGGGRRAVGDAGGGLGQGAHGQRPADYSLC